MVKIPRNDPCPCGSGKKYKKCCLAQTFSVTDFTWQKLRQTEGTLVPMLMEFVAKQLRENILLEAWEEFNDWAEVEVDLNNLPVEFDAIFLPWLLFNWIDYSIPDSEVDLIGKPIAILFLESNVHKLDSFQKKFITAVCAEQFSFFVVTDVIPGQHIVLKDLLLVRTIDVHESQGSETLQVGHIIFARVMTMNDCSIIVGCAPTVIPENYHSYFIDLRSNWRPAFEEMGDEILFELDDEIRSVYLEISAQLQHQSIPQLQNNDGDLIEFVQLHYQLSCSVKEAFAALKTLAKSVSEDELLRDAEFNNQGGLKSIKIPWLEKTGSEKMMGEITLKGDLNISPSKLVVNVNSHTRSNTIKRKISRRLGKRAIYKNSVIQSSKKMMETMRQEHSTMPTQAKLSSKELESLPEVQDMLKKVAAQHWENWLDVPLPALKDKTPREAAKSAQGRKRLEAVFLKFEGLSSNRVSDPLVPNIKYLKDELGMSQS